MTGGLSNLGYSCEAAERYTLDVCGYRVRVCENVYEPAEDTWMLSRVLEEADGGRVCIDIGTGSGVLASCLKRRCGYTVAVDLSPCATSCASNLIDARLDVVQCEGVSCIRGAAAELVVFNAPYLPGEPRDEVELAWHGGARVVERVLRELAGWERCWSLLVTLSSVTPAEEVLAYAERLGLNWEKLECLPEDFFVETCVYRITPARCASRTQR